jgi:DNA helicase-2/ATP-dependent DNA helicase PcrA
MTKPTPTHEQADILDFIRSSKSNLMIRAYAGCGKTSTLEMIDEASSIRPKLFLCFNKEIAKQAKDKMSSTTSIRTFNSIGHTIWSDTIAKKLTLNPKKILEIYCGIVNAADRSDRSDLWSIYDLVRSGVDLARALGYIPAKHQKSDKSLTSFHELEQLLDETPSPEVHAIIDRVLLECIRLSYQGIVDFNDQVYMPALFGGLFPQFPMVLVDEYQDLSPINHAMVKKLSRTARQIGVGDEAQAIYAFRGADAEGMDRAIKSFSMDVKPLSISFRCPSEIVKNVKWRVPAFRSAKAGGTVTINNSARPTDLATVLCRNNAPLTKLAMQSLIAGHNVDVSGIDMGARIVAHMRKLGSETMTQAQTINAINEWQALKESMDSKSAPDLAECMRVFARHAKSLSGAIAYAEHLFSQSGGTIRFMTGHKAKGLEFDTVYHLNQGLLSNRGQDPNIKYVIDTRSRDSLTYIEV